MANRFTVEAVFRGVDRMSAPVSRLQSRVGKFTRSFAGGLRKLNRGVDGFTRGLRRMATVGTVALLATSAALANVISTGAQFEQTLVTAAAKFPSEIKKGTAEYERLNKELGFAPGFIVKGTEEFERLHKAAADVGAVTEFTAQQAAEALNFLAMAGFEAEASIAALPGVVDLATVAQVDLGRATDIATDSLGAFKLLSDDATERQANLARVSDLLVTTSISANTSLEQMFESLVAGAPVAIAAGQSIEDVAAFIGIMANAGIKGSKAGRSMKNMIANLAAPGSKAAKVLEELSVETSDIDENMNRALTIFQRFGEATKDLGSAEKLAKFDIVFGKIALAASINIANATGEVGSLSQKIKENVGITKRMASVMRDTFQGRLNSLKSAIEAVKLSIFGMSEGPMADLLDRMIDWTRKNKDVIATPIAEWIVKVVDNIGKIVSFLRQVGIGLVVFFTLVAVLRTLAGVLTIVNLLMTMNPLGLAVVAAGALVVALVGLIFFWDEFLVLLRQVPGPIGRLPQVISDLKIAFQPLVDMVKDFVSWLLTGLDKLQAFGSAFLTIPRMIASRFIDFDPGPPPERKFHVGPRLSNTLSDDEEAESTAAAAQVISPSERTARSIEEHSVTNTSEVTLRTDAGTSAEVTKGKLGGGLTLQPSGSF